MVENRARVFTETTKISIEGEVSMAIGDLPHIAASSYTTSVVPLAFVSGDNQAWGMQQDSGDAWENTALRNIKAQAVHNFKGSLIQASQQVEENTEMTRRLVQVFIADPNENVPLDQSLLYKGEQKFTDATDQELFFEIDINTILKAYNKERVKVVDKKVKEHIEHLEPAKIRDLKMVVVNIASF